MSKEKVTTEKSVDNKQQLEKDRVQKENAADKAKPRCSICGKYTDKMTSPQCFGHGGGGGGSSSGGGSGESAGQNVAATSSQVGKGNQTEALSAIDSSIVLTPQLEFNDIKFNPGVISELLSKNLLVINNDREKGILTIKLLDPKLVSTEEKNELNKFVNAILNELNKFKKEKGLSSDCYTIEKDKDGNVLSLRIALTNPKHYDAFIRRLANEHLLPLQNIDQEKNEKVVYPDGTNHFNPTPLSTKPTPENKKQIEEEIEQTGEKKSSIQPKSPRDGLKPKGWK